MNPVKLIVLAIILSLISIDDLKKRIIPNKYVVLLMALWVPFIFLDKNVTVVSALLGFLLGGGLMLLASVLTKGGIGLGDVKLSAALGLYLGVYAILYGIAFGFFLSGIFSVVMIAMKRLTVKDYIPLGPFLSLGMLIAYALL
jgi:leader peptidase (prepilin peptidase) / N-methyltransferase